jgi:hypothetical protein
MNKNHQIIIFYSMYFVWVFTITFLTTDQQILDYFTLAILLIYITFMREPYDALFFGLVSVIPLYLNREEIQYTPLWIPIAWGTTAIVLRKFFVLVNKVEPTS